MIDEKRFRDIERLVMANRRALFLANRRPDPPRGVTFTAPAVFWEEPKERRNVTHYHIYAPDENELRARVPLGQTMYTGIPEDTVLVSSFNFQSGLESRKVPSAGPVPWVTILARSSNQRPGFRLQK